MSLNYGVLLICNIYVESKSYLLIWLIACPRLPSKEANLGQWRVISDTRRVYTDIFK